MTKRSERTGSAAAKAVAAPNTPTLDAPNVPEAVSAVQTEDQTAKAVAAPADDKIRMFLHRDCWDEDGVRHKKGTVVPFSVDTAKALRKAGKAERYDPLLMGDA